MRRSPVLGGALPEADVGRGSVTTPDVGKSPVLTSRNPEAEKEIYRPTPLTRMLLLAVLLELLDRRELVENLSTSGCWARRTVG